MNGKRMIVLDKTEQNMVLRLFDTSKEEEHEMLDEIISIPVETFGKLLGQGKAIECTKETFN